MLPRAHPQQHLNHRPTRRPPRLWMEVRVLRRSTVRAETARGPAVGGFLRRRPRRWRRIGVSGPIALAIHPQPIIHLVGPLIASHHARVTRRAHVGRDARGGGVHVNGLLAEVGARVGGAGVVGGEDGKFHAFVEGGLGAFDEPDVAGAEHAVGRGEEVGAEGFEGGEGGVDVGEEGGGDWCGIGRLGGLEY